MAKQSAKIGYVSKVKDDHNKFVNEIIERKVAVDILRNNFRMQYGEAINGTLRLSNRISFIADKYSFEHSSNLRYIVLDGQKWTISSFEITRPKIVLEIGGVYNG